MAATGGGKIRTRRYHIASKPYSKGNQHSGLISRVTDTVKSIVPSWLQKYFRNGEAGGGDGSTLGGPPAQDTPTENCERDSPVMDGRGTPEPSTSGAEPSTSRSALNFQDVLARPPLSRSHLHFSALDGSPAPLAQPSTSSTPFPGGPFTQPSTSSAPFPVTPFTHPSTSVTSFPGGPSSFSLVKEIKDSASQHEDDNISTTSGFSSRASDKDMTTSKPVPLPLLWSPENERTHAAPPPAQPALKKPAFNLSVFGTSSASLMNSSALNSSQLGDSPFYPGKTTYGGAAAARSSARVRPGTPYQAPVKRQIKAKPAGGQACGVTSATARRILLSLERMSSPLADAKRIPSSVSSPLSTSLDRPDLDAFPSQSKRKKVDSPLPPVQRLMVPVTAVGSRPVSFRPSLTPSGSQSRVLDRRSVRDTLAGPSTLSDISEAPRSTSSFAYPLSSTPMANSNGGAGGKMKRERTTRPSSRRSDEEVTVEPKLPAVSLPISTFSLPTFSFSSPPTTTSSAAPITPAPSTPLTSKLIPLSSNPPFTFSSPIVKAAASSPPVLSPSASGFTFSAPVLKSAPANINGKTLVSPAKSSPPGGPAACEQFEGPFKPAKVLKQGSVLDILRGPGFSSSPPTARSSPGPDASVQDGASAPSIGFGIRPPPGSWSCGTCLVQNGASDSKCAACGAARPSMDSSALPQQDGQASAPSSSSAGFGALFAPPAGSWECDTCLVQNKPDVVRCVACETAKPGTGVKPSLTLPAFTEAQASPASTSTASTPAIFSSITAAATTSAPSGFAGFGNKFKKAEGSWECETCMVENKAQDATCVACQSQKPGGAAASIAPSSAAGSTPAPTGGALPGFGDKFKKPEGSWDCEVCLVQNKADALQCVACQSSKPGASLPPKGFDSAASAPPSFKFGLPSSSSSSTNSTSSSTTSSSGGFKFANPTLGGFKFSAPPEGFKFGSPSSTAKTEEGKKDDPQGGGFKFSFGSSGDGKEGPTEGFSFGLAKADEKGTFSFSTLKGKSGSPDEASSTETKPATSFMFGKSVDVEPVKDQAQAASLFGQAAETSQGGVRVTAPAPGSTPTFSFGKAEDKQEPGVPSAGFLFSKSKENPTPSLGFSFNKPDPPKEQPKPSFSFGVASADSGASKSAFGFTAGSTTTATSASSASTTQAPSLFGASSTPASSASTTQAPSLFGASSTPASSASTTQAPSLFGASSTPASSASTTQAPSLFGAGSTPASSASTTQAPSLFGAGSTPASSASTTQAPSLFGASTKPASTTPAPSLFGASSTPAPAPVPSSNPGPFLFGQCVSTETPPAKTFVFGQQQDLSPMQATPQNTPAAPTSAQPFVFGSGAQTAVPSFNFGAAAPSAGSSTVPGQSSSPFVFSSATASSATPAGSSFGLGQTLSFGQGSSQPGAPAFGSAAPSLFSAPVSQPPSFGAQPSANPAPMFGQPASANPTFGSTTASSGSVGGFQFGGSGTFGASSSSTGVFTFGGVGASASASAAPATQPPAPTGGFNFSVRPTFNIGSAKSPASASAPGSHSISGRKIKTAVRRRK
ncbi:nuclear pore complex protein Nup153 isoform X2 [Brienomyrus brachyistius]|uniref:nuclear pore complex protein Nup153 isoform X2 n=1 Tax=Brienomyrus brachyistius TaxID=42636 RepID=UPI0020B2965E|nr:nuclear pore complex protein Nup153 isoform X2 [Brienomyrus brachyistius]